MLTNKNVFQENETKENHWDITIQTYPLIPARREDVIFIDKKSHSAREQKKKKKGLLHESDITIRVWGNCKSEHC